MEFSTLNGYKVKDKKAIRFYDIVDNMINDSTLKEGMHVKTKGYYDINDGGSADYHITSSESNSDFQEELQNGLYATLIVENNTINIKQLGATASNDSGLIINNILNKGFNVFAPEGEYNVETTINPPSDSKIKINGTLNNSTNNPTIKIENNHIELYCNKLVNTGNSVPLLIESNSTYTKCSYNNIEIDTIVSLNHGIYLHAIKKGIVYNNITFKSISAGSDYYGIYIKTESDPNKSYINENTINGGKLLNGLYGLYIDTEVYSNNHEVNGMKFNNLCFEGVTNGVYMNNARNNIINNPRTAELSGLYVYLKGKADGNFFNFLEMISYLKFDIHELDDGRASYNYLNGTISDGSGGRLAKDFITYNKRLQIRELLNKVRWFQITDSNIPKDDQDNPLPYHIQDNRVGNYLYMSSTLSPDIYLNQYYGSAGINDIYVTGRVGKPFKLYDNYETLIWDYDGVAGERKHFVCRDNTDSTNDAWFEV